MKIRNISVTICVLCGLLLAAIVTCHSEIVKQQSDRIEGVDPSGTRWAYEFNNDATLGKKSLLDSSAGMVIFQDSDWIVKASVSGQSTGSSRTDLLFFNSKTLKLISGVKIPNLVVKIGKIPEKKIFYVLTSTPHKYNYNDAPLAVCLIDPNKKQIDRIILIKENHWLALNNPASISTDHNRVLFSYDVACQGGDKNEYLTAAARNPYFKDISVVIQPVSKGILGEQGLRECADRDFKENSVNDLAALSALGVKPLSDIPFLGTGASGKTQESTLDSVAETDQPLRGIHLIRSFPSGELGDFILDSLKSDLVKVDNSRPYQPGIFSDGTLRCVINQKPVLVKNQKIIRPNVQKAAWFFNKSYGFSLPFRKSALGEYLADDDWVRRWDSNPIPKILSIDASGNIHEQAVKSPTSADIDPKPFYSGYFLFPETGNVFLVARYERDGHYYVHQRYSMCDGSKIGVPFTNTTGNTGGDYGEDGTSSAGWHVMSLVTEAYTSSIGYSVIAKSDDGGSTVTVAEHLPEIAHPLELRLGANGNLQVVYSFSGNTRFAEYSKTGQLVHQTEWKSSPMDGCPLVLSERNLLFIPRPGGYEVYRIFERAEPEKAFELFVRGDSQYAILLPSGAYAGSPGCEALLNLPANGSKIDSYSLSPWRNRPSLVIKALGGDPRTAELLEKVTDRWLKRIGFDPTTPEPTANEIAKVSVPQMPPLWAPSSQVVFPIEATAGSEPLKEVTVRVNGVLQRSFKGNELSIQPGGHATLDATVNLAEGQNWIEVTATDVKGRPSNLEHFRTILPKAQETPKRYIVAMGCSEYDRPELNLQYAAKDAGDVLKTFSEAGGRESKTLLLTNNDDGPEALEKIKAFTADTKESDEVILFCAGHGMLDEHLDYVYAGHNFDPEHPGQTGIKLAGLIDAISAGKSLKRLIFMDTCQSGLVGEKDELKLAQMDTTLPTGVRAIKNRGMKVLPVALMSGTDQQRFIEELFLLPGLHRGVNIIGASGGAEYAMESSQWNNGVFTSSIIEAIRDKKADMNNRGRISVSDLKTYLAKRVPELTGGAQKPSVVAFEQDQDFDLVGKMPPVPKSVMNTHAGIVSPEPVPRSLLADNRQPVFSPEDVIRNFYNAIEGANESEVSKSLADEVDYYKSGVIPKIKVMADIKGDWKRYKQCKYQISDFTCDNATTCNFVLSYDLFQGDKPRSGKLRMSISLSGSTSQKITKIAANVITAK